MRFIYEKSAEVSIGDAALPCAINRLMPVNKDNCK